MMDNEEYDNWFGLSCKEISNNGKENEGKEKIRVKEEDEIEENIRIKEEEEDEIEEGEITDKSNSQESEKNRNTHKSFLCKKRNHLNHFENKKNNNINEQNMENNQNNEKKNLIEKKIEILNNEMLNKNYLNKKHYIIEEIKDKERIIIKFNGFFKTNENIDKNYEHYTYLRTQNDFNSDAVKKEYKWKITFTCNANFIGIGLADKYIVNENNNKFFSRNENFYNGVFCLFSTYNRERKANMIYPWNPKNPSLNKYIVNFVPFVQNQEVTLIYNTFHKTLTFLAKMKNNKNKFYRMKDVKPRSSIPRAILTPCVIFFYPETTVQISRLESFDYKEKKV